MPAFGRRRGWVLVVVAALLVAVASGMSRSLPATIAAMLVAAVGVVTGVLSQRGVKALSDDTEFSRHAAHELFADHRGRVPRVRDVTDPVVIGVHRTAASKTGNADRLPPFVRRDCSAELEKMVTRGGFVVVVGESTAGKSRAAFEAIQMCLPDHRFLIPTNRAAVRTLPEVVRQERRCVVWLDDLERYLGADGLTVHLLAQLLGDSKKHVVVLATMRVHERLRYSPRHEIDADAAVAEVARDGRQVLATAVEIRLDRKWSRAELERAAPHATDDRIAVALRHADQFGVAEYLASGPQLLTEWSDAWAPGVHPRGAALVAAAIDARRAGCHSALPLQILRKLHEHYLHVRGGVALRPESWEDALAWAMQPLHATSSLLVPHDVDRYLAFDYLPDAVDTSTPAAPIPTVTWETLTDHADPDTAYDIGWAAYDRKQWDTARAAFRKALDAGHLVAAGGLAECLGMAHERTHATDVLRAAITTAESLDDHSIDPLDLLNLRNRLSWWTGLQGKVMEALHLARRTAVDSARILGAQHRRALAHRLRQARWEGEAGDTALALRLADEVTADCRRLLGDEDPLTLSSRFEVAIWTGRNGDPAEAIQQFQALDSDERRTRGDDTYVLDTRSNIAIWTLHQGDVAEGLELLRNAIRDEAREFGDAHPRTLSLRLSLAYWTGRTGQPDDAQHIAEAVTAESERTLGHQHEVTLGGHYQIALQTAARGHVQDALDKFEQLLVDATQALGPHHELTLDSRSQHASLTGENGNVARAADLYKSLIVDRTAVQGPDYPATLNDREQLLQWCDDKISDAVD